MNTGGEKMGQIIGEGITFDDVLLVPSYSQVVPNQVDLTTLCRNLPDTWTL